MMNIILLVIMVFVASLFLGGASATVIDNEIKKSIKCGIVMK